jgi:hypothetical protein
MEFDQVNGDLNAYISAFLSRPFAKKPLLVQNSYQY